MSFLRLVTIVCLTSSAVLGYFVIQRGDRLDRIQRELVLVKGEITKIQELAYQLDDLQRIDSNNKFKAVAAAETYIRNTAGTRGIGQVDITPTTKTPMRDVEDRVYTIRPLRKDVSFQRKHIGEFLYKLEEEGTHVKVTSIELRPFDKVKPGEIGNDKWTFEAEVTSRTSTK